MAKSGKQRKPRENKREDIYRSALKVFSFYGYDGATLDRIASDAGVSKSLVIKLCGHKEEIAATCIQRFNQGFLASLERINTTPGLSWREQSDRIFELFQVNRSEWRFMLQILNTPALEVFSRPIIDDNLRRTQLMLHRYEADILPDRHREAAYTMVALYFSYVTGGNIQNFLDAREEIFAHYLREKPASESDT